MNTLLENTVKTSCEHIDTIKNTYKEYNENDMYVFKSCNFGKAMAILQKPENHKNNESRSNIIDSIFARHRGDSMMVVEIFDKFEPTVKLTRATSQFADTEVVYVVGELASPDSYTDDLSEDSHGIHYCRTVEGAFYYDLMKTNYTGKFYDFHFNGREKENGMLVLGKREGKWDKYYECDQLHTVSNYSNGKLDGEYFEWYDTGKKSRRCFYSNDVQTGFSISWHKNGEKKSEGYYDENGREHGDWLSWYDNGCRDDFSTWSHGTKSGPYYKWTLGPLDALEVYGEYVDGVPVIPSE